jgi:hypothetical protein
MPTLKRVTVDTRAAGTIQLQDVTIVTLRSGEEEQRRVLPAPRRHDRGIPWEGIRSIEVPPPEAYVAGEHEGDLLAPLTVVTKGTGREHVFMVDAGPGSKELLLRGLNQAGLTVSVNLLACARVTVDEP